MTPQQVISEVRVLINDDNPLMPARFTDAELLAFVNQAIQRTCAIRPDLFIVSADITPTPDQASQELPASVTRIMEVLGVVDGDALGEVDKDSMDRAAPGWRSEASDTPVNWMRHQRNPRRYFLYPRPITGTQISAEYIQVPADYALGDTMILPDSYKTAIIDCVVSLAEAVDNESVETARAKDFMDSFMQALGVDMVQRALVDNENVMQNAQSARRTVNNAQ